MRSKLSLVTGALLFAAAPAAADAPSTWLGLAGTVSGTCSFIDPMTGQTVDGTIVDGSFSVTGFSVSDGALQATGTLTGTCAAGDALRPAGAQVITTTVDPTVTSAPGSLRTLHLGLGPFDLDQPGLAVHAGGVVIAVTAQSGPGNLLGNLLWAVANALNSGAPATRLADLLNHILSISG